MAEVDSLLQTPGSKVLNIDEVEAHLKSLKWPEDHKYGGICVCKDYIKGDIPLRYIQPKIPNSYKGNSYFVPSTEKFPTDTVYKRSYEPIDKETLRNSHSKVGAPTSNLKSSGEFSPDTTHRMSYGPVPLTKPSQTYYPHEYDLKGKGPMQDVTSQQHDYTPKQAQPPRPIKYNDNIGLIDTPMENGTTNRMSFKKIDLNFFEPSPSFRPSQQLSAPSVPFPKDTVYSTSYLPTKPEPRTPANCSPEYMKPLIPMDGKSIYTRSFLPPGQFIREDTLPAEAPDKGCYCVYPGECMVETHKKAHDYEVKDNNNIVSENK